jgi:hypothetical protein
MSTSFSPGRKSRDALQAAAFYFHYADALVTIHTVTDGTGHDRQAKSHRKHCLQPHFA